MELKIEDVKRYKQADKELIKALMDRLSECEEDDIENINFKHNGTDYCLSEFNHAVWESDGKYEDSYVEYLLISHNGELNTIDTYNIKVGQSLLRSGSHFTDWHYQYLDVNVQEIGIELIPEVIIPKHEDIVFRDI